MKVNAKGIRANVKPTVTVYTLKRGNMRFGKGRPMAVLCSYFDIVVSRIAEDGGKVVMRRVKREERGQKWDTPKTSKA